MRESGLSKAGKGSGGGASSGSLGGSGLNIGKHVLGPDVDADATITGTTNPTRSLYTNHVNTVISSYLLYTLALPYCTTFVFAD